MSEALKTARRMLDKFPKASVPRNLCWKYIDSFVGEQKCKVAIVLQQCNVVFLAIEFCVVYKWYCLN